MIIKAYALARKGSTGEKSKWITPTSKGIKLSDSLTVPALFESLESMSRSMLDTMNMTGISELYIVEVDLCPTNYIKLMTDEASKLMESD